MYTAVILTLNEEHDVAECIESLHTDDIIVVDSFSTDATCAIAREHGARVIQNQFYDYASQRNFALQETDPKYPWIFMLDADERATPSLDIEIRNTLSSVNSTTTLYRLRRKDMLMGRWLRHSSGYPTWFGRLLRKDRCSFIREINEEATTSGLVGYLNEHIVHYPFSKGISRWLDRHNSYSTAEASQVHYSRERRLYPIRQLLSKDPAHRRRVAKFYVYRLRHFRPLIIFLYLYILRGGFLDGIPGIRFATLRLIYEYMIDLKISELREDTC